MRYIKQAGLTLVELMISLAIGVFLLGGVTAAYLAMRTATVETVAMSEMQQNGRMALSMLTTDIQQAGFRGMLPTFNTNTSAPAPFAGDCNAGLNGGSFPQDGLGEFPVIWGRTLAVAGGAIACINNAVADSDILQIKRATGPALPDPLPAGALDARQYYLEASGSEGNIFAGNIGPVGIAQAEIWPYRHHVYFVTTEVVDGVAVPVLARMELVNNGGPQMQQALLLDGIERISFAFGADMNGDNQIDGYIASDNMPAALWQADTDIIAVRVNVLVRATRPDNDYINANTYDLGGGNVFTPNDSFRRMLFSSTVHIANRR